MDALDALIEAVESGTATEFLFFTWRPGLTGTKAESRRMMKAYAGSLDAALALHEALLPGWQWEICSDTPDTLAILWPSGKPKDTVVGGFETFSEGNPARAWLLAILRAYRDKPPA